MSIHIQTWRHPWIFSYRTVLVLILIIFITTLYVQNSNQLVATENKTSNIISTSVIKCEPGGMQFALKERRYNSVPTEYDACLKPWLNKMVREKRKADDPELVSLVKHLLEPPSQHLYKTTRDIIQTTQAKEIMSLLKDRENGFFIEAGGLDGERGSNTLWLEAYKHWTGLLVEMDPYFYTMLKGHSRKSWTINCCLSPYNYSIIMEFRESLGGGGQLIDPDNPDRKSNAVTSVIRSIPCFPLHSILLALDRTHVDYFSLDVEGFELDVLKTIPHKIVDIETFTVEFVHGKASGPSYIKYMDSQGYSLEKELHEHDDQMSIHLDDYVFVKRK